MRMLCAAIMAIIWIVGMAGRGCIAFPTAAWAEDDHVVVDAAGRRIAVGQPFQRIICLYGAHTENLFALGAGEQVIGVARHDDWPPQAAAKPVFSYHDDLEKFLAARPDLVLIRPMIDRGYNQLVRRLEQYGICVVSLQPTTVAEMLEYWRQLGNLAGRQAAAAKMVTHFEMAVERIRRVTSSIPDKKRVYFEAIHDRMRTFAPHAMAVFTLETAGGINLAADATARRGTNIADYGKERILSHAHEIDVFLAQSGPMNQPTEDLIRAEPGFGLIRAVQAGNIYFIDEKLVSRPTPRLLEGICRIGRMLYPDLFSDQEEIPSCSCIRP